MNAIYIILIAIGLYMFFVLNKRETFAMSPSTLTQLRSTSTENQINSFVCKDCGGTDILLLGDAEYKRRNYG